ncbi:DUF3953 domain-containing protein [Ornithinibacillus scapharcae]|uniref:DUF3953 domain-containing protein n=1 Tax=Ornithinibacillus scapharcae TaxID=1147159 RepID=UPI000225BCAA|nr:DUF3953 domain-containing protein [Ornithinibacillus scapharcae]
MLTIIRIILALTVIILATYGLITQDFKYQSLMMFVLSMMMLVIAISEFKKSRTGYGWVSLIAFVFLLLVSLQGLF